MSEDARHPDFEAVAAYRVITRIIGLIGLLLAVWFIAQEPVWRALTLVVFSAPVSMIFVGVASELRRR